jgi:hypothetical protein
MLQPATALSAGTHPQPHTQHQRQRHENPAATSGRHAPALLAALSRDELRGVVAAEAAAQQAEVAAAAAAAVVTSTPMPPSPAEPAPAAPLVDAAACFLPGDPVPAMAALVREMAAAESARTRRPSVTGGPSALSPGGGVAVAAGGSSSSAAQRAISLLDAMLRAAADGDGGGGGGAVDAPTFAVCVRRAFPSLPWERVNDLVGSMHLAALPCGGRVDIADFIAAMRQLAATPALWGGDDGGGSSGDCVGGGGAA